MSKGKRKRKYRTKTRLKKINLPPGSPVYTGDKEIPLNIKIIRYGDKTIEESESKTVVDLRQFIKPDEVLWVDVKGLNNTTEIVDICNQLDIHTLVIEDILNVHQRPKFENFDRFIFLTLKMVYRNEVSEDLIFEHISMVAGDNYVITFQELEKDVFDNIRKRIISKQPALLKKKADFLVALLTDAVVDHYFIILEQIGDRIEQIEEIVINQPDTNCIEDIYNVRHELSQLRKVVWSLRTALSNIVEFGSGIFKKDAQLLFRDVYDHTIQVIDTVETSRDILSGLLDLYLSNVNNRMNEIMKVLTIFASLFLPLTFLAGIYGMNFEFMPELKWKWGYPAVILLMFIIAGGMFYYYRKKKWI